MTTRDYERDPVLAPILQTLADTLESMETLIDRHSAVRRWAQEFATAHGGTVAACNADYIQIDFPRYPTELEELVERYPSEMDLFPAHKEWWAEETDPDRLLVYLRQP